MNPSGRLFLRSLRNALVAVALVASIPNLKAATIYSDFDILNDYDCCTAQGIFGSGTLLGFRGAAVSFTASPDDPILTEIDLALSWSAGTDLVDVVLDTDGGGFPGSVLETWTLNALPSFGTCCDVQALIPTSTQVLVPGNQYWIEVFAGAPDFVGGWNGNTGGTLNPFAVNLGSGYTLVSGQTTPAFAVQGAPIPEPATWSFCAAALAFFGLRRRKR